MREILFRAWIEPKNGLTMRDKNGNILGNHMEYGVSIVDGKYASIDNYGELYGLEDYILMQYTGLTDKNGVKIYEGDIVKYDLYGDKMEIEIIAIPKISPENRHFFGELQPLVDDNYYIEVIGNTNQHPHLIP